MIAALGGVGPVLGGRDAGEGAEFVGEMGLVGVAELRGEGAPVGGIRLADGAQNGLQPANAREALRREAGVSDKAAGEGFGQQSELGGDGGDGDGPAQSGGCPGNGGVNRGAEMAEEPGFEDG